jgi:hypothetical protein
MPYAVENALYQWQEGQRRVRGEPELERAAEIVLDELRRRLGSTFVLSELADYYGADPDWALELASRYSPSGDSAAVVDAAFARYAREASNYAGGRAREEHSRE